MAFYKCSPPAVEEVILWENPSPTSDLAAQTIRLDSGHWASYAFIKFEYVASKTSSDTMSVIAKRTFFESNSVAISAHASSSTNYGRLLGPTQPSATSNEVVISACKVIGGTATNNGNVILTKIMGVKNYRN